MNGFTTNIWRCLISATGAGWYCSFVWGSSKDSSYRGMMNITITYYNHPPSTKKVFFFGNSYRKKGCHLGSLLRIGISTRLQGPPEYERLFATAPFARHGGLTGTTKRLSSWCMNLARTAVLNCWKWWKWWNLNSEVVGIFLWSHLFWMSQTPSNFCISQLAHTWEECKSSGVPTTTSCAGLVFHWYTTLQCLGLLRFWRFWEDLKRSGSSHCKKKYP